MNNKQTLRILSILDSSFSKNYILLIIFFRNFFTKMTRLTECITIQFHWKFNGKKKKKKEIFTEWNLQQCNSRSWKILGGFYMEIGIDFICIRVLLTDYQLVSTSIHLVTFIKEPWRNHGVQIFLRIFYFNLAIIPGILERIVARNNFCIIIIIFLFFFQIRTAPLHVKRPHSFSLSLETFLIFKFLCKYCSILIFDAYWDSDE